jgi:dCTP diphosphatase
VLSPCPARASGALRRTRQGADYCETVSDKPAPSVRDRLAAFVAERDWAQFHTSENLAKSIAIEAGELLECFQWSGEADEARVRDELADVLTYCTLLAAKLGVDPEQLILDKLAVTREKYPVEKARGRSAKYDAL